MINAVIYDMDGVLIDSEPLWRKAAIEVYTSYGIPLTDAMCRETAGLRVDEFAVYCLHRFNRPNINAQQLTDAIIDNVIARINAQDELMIGVLESLSFWQKSDVKLGLASSSPMRIIATVLDKFGIRAAFEIIHSAEHEAFGKPHPAVYLSAAQKLGVPPTECLAIEDSVNGLIAAKAARMKAIVIPEPAARADRRFGIADLQLNSLAEIGEETCRRLDPNL